MRNISSPFSKLINSHVTQISLAEYIAIYFSSIKSEVTTNFSVTDPEVNVFTQNNALKCEYNAVS